MGILALPFSIIKIIAEFSSIQALIRTKKNIENLDELIFIYLTENTIIDGINKVKNPQTQLGLQIENIETFINKLNSLNLTILDTIYRVCLYGQENYYLYNMEYFINLIELKIYFNKETNVQFKSFEFLNNIKILSLTNCNLMKSINHYKNFNYEKSF